MKAPTTRPTFVVALASTVGFIYTFAPMRFVPFILGSVAILCSSFGACGPAKGSHDSEGKIPMGTEEPIPADAVN